MRFLRNSIFFGLFTLLAAEGLLRARQSLFDSAAEIDRAAYNRKIFARIYDKWLRTEANSPFLPPFRVFANRDFSDPARLRSIFETTRLEPGHSWQSYDFLQDEKFKEQTSYSIRSNSFGFRGAERERVKPKNVKRIIALGAYTTFGHAVEESDTYEAQLENILNASPEKFRFEVWNGGRQAASAIMGLARLSNEIFDYKPDLLVVEYGFVDTYVWDDNLQPVAMRFPDSPSFKIMRKILRPLMPVVANSLLWDRVAGRYTYRTLPTHLENFRAVMQKIIDLASRSGVPVILVRPLQSENQLVSVFQGLAGPSVAYVDTTAVLKAYAGAPPKIRANSWMRELPTPWPVAICPLCPYKIDWLQMNGEGYRLLAEALAPEVRRLLNAGTYSTQPRR